MHQPVFALFSRVDDEARKLALHDVDRHAEAFLALSTSVRLVDSHVRRSRGVASRSNTSRRPRNGRANRIFIGFLFDRVIKFGRARFATWMIRASYEERKTGSDQNPGDDRT